MQTALQLGISNGSRSVIPLASVAEVRVQRACLSWEWWFMLQSLHLGGGGMRVKNLSQPRLYGEILFSRERERERCYFDGNEIFLVFLYGKISVGGKGWPLSNSGGDWAKAQSLDRGSVASNTSPVWPCQVCASQGNNILRRDPRRQAALDM